MWVIRHWDPLMYLLGAIILKMNGKITVNHNNHVEFTLFLIVLQIVIQQVLNTLGICIITSTTDLQSLYILLPPLE